MTKPTLAKTSGKVASEFLTNARFPERLLIGILFMAPGEEPEEEEEEEEGEEAVEL